MAHDDAAEAAAGQQASGKRQGPDGRWMLKLVYPNASNLDSYLEIWLQDVLTAAAPGSASAVAINSCGGPGSYLSREDDGPEFKKVSVWIHFRLEMRAISLAMNTTTSECR